MVKRSVLVVDDEKVNRRILNKLLEDYNVLEASDGEEALKVLRADAEQISAVLLDIVMPVMDGFEVLRVMSEDPKLSKIPVIVSSQKNGDNVEIKALSLGAQDFIAKPYKAEIIRRRLNNLIKFRETAALINKVERDELLMHISRLLSTAQRPIYAARFSADLFFLFVPHRDSYDESPIRLWYEKVNEFPISMDIKMHCGIYEIEDPELPVSVMCDRTQLASEKNKGMYDAPFFLYDNSLRQKLLDEQFVTMNMRTALEEKQFEVYYQPKYDLQDERIAGAEALVRWIHPQRGLINPGVFIPLFERSGFISELDHYVWRNACSDIRRWMELGLPPIAVSVNVSRADIYDPGLSRILIDMLNEYHIPIKYLHLEITESAYTDNPEQIILEVEKLRRLGFIIEMDDFGSGYSSLNMLAEMPVDVLKLDMRFIQKESVKTSGKGVLSFVISLAKWLDLAVVAEGVETGEQIAMLRSMDCNYVQGFYYAKPMRRADFELLLSTSSTTEMICTSRTVRPTRDVSVHASTRSTRQMLIVDDMDFNRAVLAGNFDTEYTIVERENGSEAWSYLLEHYTEVEIVLLDLLMPVMDGFRLLDKIRSDERIRDIPVIITSQGDVESESRALRMGADDFISKPYNPEIVRHRVQNVIACHRLQKLERVKKQEEK